MNNTATHNPEAALCKELQVLTGLHNTPAGKTPITVSSITYGWKEVIEPFSSEDRYSAIFFRKLF